MSPSPDAGRVAERPAAAMAWLRWPDSSDRVLGRLVGISLPGGGMSTIWLRWKTGAAED